jgi:penicillin-binding protein 1A
VILKAIGTLLISLLLLAITGSGAVLYVFYHYGRGLPDYKQLATYEPPTVTRIHAGDGRLIAEYAIEKRVFVPIEAMPKRVIKAFLAAEDKNFYEHPGIDLVGVVRALITNLANVGTSRRPTGGSTITQQVAKNFLLTSEVSLERKIKEAILAFRIERALTKDRILELYLNEIYLGFGSYGVAAAALNYFNKSLDEISIAEAAYLAALPKAPNNYHPIHRPEAATARRNWAIRRMLEERYVTPTEAAEARATPLEVRSREETEFVPAEYFVEEVRRELLERSGTDGVYEGGLSVRTTVDPRLQGIADRMLRRGLIAYDQRHGWRGPIARLELDADWAERIAEVPLEPGLNGWRLAVVLAVEKSAVDIGFADDNIGLIPFAELKWARPWRKNQRLGPPVKSAHEILAIGDVVAVEPVTAGEDGTSYPPDTYALRQIPDVEGALVAMDPHTGRVLAMSGGFSYEKSEFNRATQAWRQPGSAFKPFVYLAALTEGLTPSTLVLDAPFVIDQGPGLGKWKPANFTRKFYGPSPMRIGIEKSRNLMTVRLAQTIGIENASASWTRCPTSFPWRWVLARRPCCGSPRAMPCWSTAAGESRPRSSTVSRTATGAPSSVTTTAAATGAGRRPCRRTSRCRRSPICASGWPTRGALIRSSPCSRGWCSGAPGGASRR